MKQILYILVLLIGISFQSYAQSGKGLMSNTAIGHICVTLLSPAAISSVQDLSFSNVSLRSSYNVDPAEESTRLKVANENMQMASLKVQGNKASYSVTVTNRTLGFNQYGNTISVGNFSATSNYETNGTSTIHIGATMHVRNAIVDINDKVSQFAVTVNYN